MRAFTHIFSGFYPEIDIMRAAFEHPSDRNSVINEDFVSYAFINALHRGSIVSPDFSKFKLLKDSIIENRIASDEKREEIIERFYRAQRCYHGLCRLARLWKVTHARRGTSEHDLYMNPLDTLKEHLTLDLYDDDSRTLYKFRVSDLMCMAKSALSNSPEFFADPQEIRNPYTNLPFTQAQLYSIYLHVKGSNYDVPLLFSQYYKSGFVIRDFCEENECYIRDVAIENFTSCGSDPEKYYYVMKMLRDHRHNLNGVSIHPGFPGESLLETFLPYLEDYLCETFSLNPSRKYRAKLRLKMRLERFGRLNPTYGRKIIEIPDTEHPLADGQPPEFRTAYIDNVVLHTPRLTPRGQARRRARALDEGSLDSTPELAGRSGRVVEMEPAPNPEEAVQRAEAGAYRAARELERAEEAMNEVSNTSADATERTLHRLENLRSRINEASLAVEQAQQLESPPLVSAAIATVAEAASRSDDGAEQPTALSRRPLPELPTANIRAIMARYRASRPRHPSNPEVDPAILSPPLAPGQAPESDSMPTIDQVSDSDSPCATVVAASSTSEDTSEAASGVPLEEDI